MTVQELRKDPVFQHFYRICQIPHESGREKALSDDLLVFARDLGLQAVQDAYNNVLIRKAASPGYEAVPTVMLQAHIDMVCEKAADSPHDFAKDPIPWVVEGDILSTGHQTTLGVDDGIGVAIAMAVLEDDTLLHPELEVLFTTNEEDDFSGIIGFDASQSRALYVINLDNGVASEVICGSCGGKQADFGMPVTYADVEMGMRRCELTVSGLKGGHSGEDIHRGRGNANILLTRALLALRTCGVKLASIRGGSYRLAIPRYAQAQIYLPEQELPHAQAMLQQLQTDFARELTATSRAVQLELTVCPEAEQADETLQRDSGTGGGQRRAADPDRILQVLTLLPDGICQMNETLTGIVDTSDNLGEVYLSEEDGFHAVIEIRSAQPSLGDYLGQKMQILADLTGGQVSFANPYASWQFYPYTRLRTVYSEMYEKIVGVRPKLMTVHCGLEIGMLIEKRPQIEAIAIGPDMWDYHSPDERISISSTRQIYQILCETLRRLGE